VLVVEDDESVRRSTELLLARAGLEPTSVATGEHGLTILDAEEFDVVVLDLMLPGTDGFEVCRRVRRSSSVPIVMLTARAETADVVAGLELGADDYVTKPFDGAELIARIGAVLRRGDHDPQHPVLRSATLELCSKSFRVTKDGQPLDLTATEFRLLHELMRHAGQVMTRELLLELVWGYDCLGDSRLVDMAVKRLRQKLLDDARAPRLIATVRTIGYRFEEPTVR
jgi:two-component system response regulator MtrA